MSEQKLREALQCLYDETADYIRINNLGDVHQNRSMRLAREALSEPPTSDEGTLLTLPSPNERSTLTDDIRQYLRQLSPHVREREAARLLQLAVEAIEHWRVKAHNLERALHASDEGVPDSGADQDLKDLLRLRAIAAEPGLYEQRERWEFFFGRDTVIALLDKLIEVSRTLHAKERELEDIVQLALQIRDDFDSGKITDVAGVAWQMGGSFAANLIAKKVKERYCAEAPQEGKADELPWQQWRDLWLSERSKVIKLDQEVKRLQKAATPTGGGGEPDNTKVICPSCTYQFRAIPVQVQNLMLDAGFEPPFTAPQSGKKDE